MFGAATTADHCHRYRHKLENAALTTNRIETQRNESTADFLLACSHNQNVRMIMERSVISVVLLRFDSIRFHNTHTRTRYEPVRHVVRR